MSSDRNINAKPLKPSLASTRTVRSPLTPRIAGNALNPAPSTRSPATPRLPSTRPVVVSPRLKPLDGTTTSPNVTPSSTARRSRVGVSPSQDDVLSDNGAKSSVGNAQSLRPGGASTFGIGSAGPSQSTGRMNRPRSTVSDRASDSPSVLRATALHDTAKTPGQTSIDSQFFHASDMSKQEPAAKRPEAKKAPSFFYADGREDKPVLSPGPPSPVLSAVSAKRSSGPWSKPLANPSKSPTTVSPNLSVASPTSFFPPSAAMHGHLRSPSPSKENIHLSYRKGASQIFGLRPTPPPTSTLQPELLRSLDEDDVPLSGLASSHRKSQSVSSVDSGMIQQSRRRSGTANIATSSGSPLTQETNRPTSILLPSPSIELPSIDTSLGSAHVLGSPGPLSPTKHASELAAEARRERKVLDLEISNSSLLAINASLEREVRRQKAELKRFRRLSRAGRFSAASNDFRRSSSTELDTLDEGDESEDDLSSVGDDQDDLSDSEEGSLLSGGDQQSSVAYGVRGHDRLAKDEKRLRVDLERHKELLVQSQSMNQSLKRCMYATEEMIREGKKALEYHVRVSDVKLGGRILTGHDDEEIEVDDESYADLGDDSMESAKGLLDVWSGVGVADGSEASGDRDSGIEVEKSGSFMSRFAQLPSTSAPMNDSGRPPDNAVASDMSRQDSSIVRGAAIPLRPTPAIHL